MEKGNQIKELQNLLNNITTPQPSTSASVSELIEFAFLSEYKRLLELIIELEEMTNEKLKRLIKVTKKISSLSHKKEEEGDYLNSTREIKTIINDIASENYSIWAETYNALVFYSEEKVWKQELSRILDFLHRNIDPSQNQIILDVGTGTGFPSLILPRIFNKANIHAFDNSEAMLKKAKEFERQIPWKIEPHTITSLLQEKLNILNIHIQNPRKIVFHHSPTITLERNSVDAAVMATAIPSYTSYTYELVQSIFDTLKPGKRALVNFSATSFSRMILLIRDFGLKKGLAIARRPAHLDIILETTDGGKKVFSMKINYSKKTCEEILLSVGFIIKKKRSLFPLLYFLLAISKQAGYSDKRRIRSPYMLWSFTSNPIKKLLYDFLFAIDSFLAQWLIPTAYEYWYEVEKPQQI